MKKLTLILTMVLIVSAIGGGSINAFAATNNIDASDVLFYLKNSQFAG